MRTKTAFLIVTLFAGIVYGGCSGSAVVSCGGCSSPVSLTLSDNFHRPNRTGLGLADYGQVWQLTGPGQVYTAGAQILTDTYAGAAPISSPANGNTIYAYQNLASPVARADGTFTFSSSPGGVQDSAVAIAISSDPSNVISQMIHLECSTSNCYLTWWNGVSTNEAPQKCSGPNPHYSALTLGTQYSVSLRISGTGAEVMFPDGTLMDCVDANFAPLSTGTLAFWELDYDATSKNIPVFNAASAYEVSPDRGQTPD
jgi:hypothetical protein